MDPLDYPSTRRLGARALRRFGLRPTAAAGREDYPVNDATRRSRSRTSTRSAAARSSTPRTSRASTRAISACARSTVSPTTGRSTTRRWRRATTACAHDRRLRARGRSGRSAKQLPLPPVPLGPLGERLRRLEPARLALVAVGQRDHDAGVRGPRRVHQPRPVRHGLRAGRQGQHRRHLLAGRAPERRRLRTRCRVRESRSTRTAWPTARLLDARRRRAAPDAPRSWCSRATASARRACC